MQHQRNWGLIFCLLVSSALGVPAGFFLCHYVSTHQAWPGQPLPPSRAVCAVTISPSSPRSKQPVICSTGWPNAANYRIRQTRLAALAPVRLCARSQRRCRGGRSAALEICRPTLQKPTLLSSAARDLLSRSVISLQALVGADAGPATRIPAGGGTLGGFAWEVASRWEFPDAMCDGSAGPGLVLSLYLSWVGPFLATPARPQRDWRLRNDMHLRSPKAASLPSQGEPCSRERRPRKGVAVE